MNKFVDFPLQQLLNRENIFSRVDKLEHRALTNPSAKVTRLDQFSQNTGDLVISGSLVVYDPETGLANVTLNETNPETGTEAGIVLRNGVSSINFADSSGYAGNMFVYATTDDNIGLYNLGAQKSVLLGIKLTDATYTSVYFRENLSVPNQTEFVVPAGSAGASIVLGGTTITGGTTDAASLSVGSLYLPAGINTIIFDDDNPLSDGWFLTTDTCTQTGSYTFTLPGNGTQDYRKGAKFACLNPTAKYGVIGNSAYVTTDDTTTVTLITNSDYLLTTDAITVPQLSFIDTPLSFPQFFNFSANPTGFSVQPPTPTYRWKTSGNQIFIEYVEASNGTSNATTFTATAPIAPVYLTSGVAGTLVDNGAVLTVAGRVVIAAASTTIVFRTDMASGAWTNANGKRAVCFLWYEF